MDFHQRLLLTFILVIGTQLTRWLAFLIFPENQKIPAFIHFLGNHLPPALMGLLVIYALKNINLAISPYGIPDLLAAGTTVLVYRWKENMAFGILSGTGAYILLMRCFESMPI